MMKTFRTILREIQAGELKETLTIDPVTYYLVDKTPYL